MIRPVFLLFFSKDNGISPFFSFLPQEKTPAKAVI